MRIIRLGNEEMDSLCAIPVKNISEVSFYKEGALYHVSIYKNNGFPLTYALETEKDVALKKYYHLLDIIQDCKENE